MCSVILGLVGGSSGFSKGLVIALVGFFGMLGCSFAVLLSSCGNPLDTLGVSSCVVVGVLFAFSFSLLEDRFPRPVTLSWVCLLGSCLVSSGGSFPCLFSFSVSVLFGYVVSPFLGSFPLVGVFFVLFFSLLAGCFPSPFPLSWVCLFRSSCLFPYNTRRFAFCHARRLVLCESSLSSSSPVAVSFRSCSVFAPPLSIVSFSSFASHRFVGHPLFGSLSVE